MKKIKLTLLLLVVLNCISYAQYFEWAHEVSFASHGTSASNITTDHNGNAYFIRQYKACMICSSNAEIIKLDAAGNETQLLNSYSANGSVAYNSISLDYAGNMYVSATQGGNSFTIQTVFSTTAANFVIKANSSGTVQWLLGSSGGFKVAADSSGVVYYTNGSRTEKRDSSGTIIWTDSISGGGGDIGIDGSHRCIITDVNHTIKYYPNGTIFYNKAYGGNYIAVNRDGSAFLLSNAGLQKLDPNGIISWTNPAIQGNDVATSNFNAYVVNGNTISRITSNGQVVNWALSSSNAPFNSIAVDNSNNVFGVGIYDILQLATAGPYKLATAINFSNLQGFSAKINVSLPIPFQAGIFTGDLSPFSHTLCKQQVYNIPFTPYLNSVSSFNGNNQFKAQISSDGFVNDINDMGLATVAQVPASVPAGTNYRVRVISTSPQVNGYPNYVFGISPLVTVRENEAIINSSGPLTFCQGDSVILSAVFQTYTTGVNWSTGSNAQSITVKTTGQYTCAFFNGVCFGIDTVNVTVTSKPSATISPSGNLSFCTGPGVSLQANTGAGLTYQWKKNSANIGGATNANYLANSTGTFNVVVTNSNGCSKGATPVSVTSPPSITITPSGATNFCTGGSVTLSATSGQAVTYKWKKNGALISGATNSSYVATTTGSYNCIVTNSFGCSKGGTPINITGPPSAVITANGSTTFCAGGSVQLSAVSGYTAYKWILDGVGITGATLSSYTATTAGNYKVNVTDQFGCSKTTPTTNQITVNVPCREGNLLETQLTSISMEIFPNPSSGKITVAINSDVNFSNGAIEIFNSVGQSILKQPIKTNGGSNSQEVNIEKYPAGIYFINLYTNSGNQWQKIIRE